MTLCVVFTDQMGYVLQAQRHCRMLVCPTMRSSKLAVDTSMV